jgi:hypothetical protein
MMLVRIEGKRAVIEAPKASAPGSRLKGTTDDGLPIQIKVQRCVRDGDRFVVEGRIIDMKRQVRETFDARLAHHPGVLLS